MVYRGVYEHDQEQGPQRERGRVRPSFYGPGRGGRPAGLQDTAAIKQRADYMSDVLRRNTKPLGLKEDKLLRELLRQANIKWAIRASGRSILD